MTIQQINVEKEDLVLITLNEYDKVPYSCKDKIVQTFKEFVNGQGHVIYGDFDIVIFRKI